MHVGGFALMFKRVLAWKRNMRINDDHISKKKLNPSF